MGEQSADPAKKNAVQLLPDVNSLPEISIRAVHSPVLDLHEPAEHILEVYCYDGVFLGDVLLPFGQDEGFDRPMEQQD